METVLLALSPRKTPIQARSVATVEAIQIATIQVLTAEGLGRCTTTRVAERAGVSVGSLYQYYPNRRCLLAAVLERHLALVAEAVERACAATHGRTTREMGRVIAGSYLDAKLHEVETSTALYSVLEEHGGAQLVKQFRTRMARTIARMLLTSSDRRFDEVETVSEVVLSAISGPIRAVLEKSVSPNLRRTIREHVILLATSYLREVSKKST
ncbi:TetR/AcrR family transcriptional regulator [Polaromonas sp.]|uniref:TetR/AcrR family transcriptional regulator n=1 Tax=Polaromonas sp. TaxID=1869339 RepID=UPI003BA89A86